MSTATHEMQKCCVKGIQKAHQSTMHNGKCSFRECMKLVQHQCCTNIIYKSKGKKKISRTSFEDMSFCTGGHHDTYAKSKGQDNLNWSNDSTNGHKDPLTSQYFLIKWLSIRENYHNYCSLSGRRAKIDIATEIAAYINSKGVKITLRGKTVQTKITWVKGRMCEAYDFTFSQMGEGIQQNE